MATRAFGAASALAAAGTVVGIVLVLGGPQKLVGGWLNATAFALVVSGFAVAF